MANVDEAPRRAAPSPTALGLPAAGFTAIGERVEALLEANNHNSNPEDGRGQDRAALGQTRWPVRRPDELARGHRIGEVWGTLSASRRAVACAHNGQLAVLSGSAWITAVQA